MESSPTMAKTDSLKANIDTDVKHQVDGTCVSEMTGTILEIDPKKEAAALRKFDKYVLPVSVIFLVLSTLDRNNVSCVVDPQNQSFLNFNSLEMLELLGLTRTSDSRAVNLVISLHCRVCAP